MTDHSSDDLTQPLRRPSLDAAPTDGTEVMSLDDLLEIAAEPAPDPGTRRRAPVGRPVARTADPGPLSLRPAPAAAPAAAAGPARTRPKVPPFPPATTGAARPRPASATAKATPTWERIRRDALTVGHGALRTTNSWLETGDNALIVAAVTLALFLLLAVGLL